MRVLAHLRHHAVGYAALFVALGGTSYAAAGGLPGGSKESIVGSSVNVARGTTTTLFSVRGFGDIVLICGGAQGQPEGVEVHLINTTGRPLWTPNLTIEPGESLNVNGAEWLIASASDSTATLNLNTWTTSDDFGSGLARCRAGAQAVKSGA